MGTEASKPVQPPEDWEPQGARRAFEVISPVSDISNPSDIHKLQHHHQHRYELRQRPLQAMTGKNKKLFHQEQQPASSNNHRRVSRTVTTTLPIATKVSRRSGSGENAQIPAPSSFYFPTKETERYAEQAAKSSDNENKENRILQDIARQDAKKTGMRKKLLKKMTACLEDSNEDEMEPVILQQRPNHLVQAKLPVAQFVSGNRGRRSSTSLQDSKYSAVARNVPLQKFKADAKEKSQQRKSSITDTVSPPHMEEEIETEDHPSAALHREDEYFNRLSMSPSSIPAVSPFVSNPRSNRVTAIHDKSSARKSFPAVKEREDPSAKFDRSSMPTSGLNTTMDMAAMTPVSQLTKKGRTSDPVSVDSPIDTPVSDLFSANSSIPGMQDDDKMLSVRSMKSNNSTVSSLMRFYTKSGPMGSSPETYNSNAGGDDDDTKTTQDSPNEKSHYIRESLEDEDIPSDEEGPDKRKSSDSNSSLYTQESKSYDKPNGKGLQMLVHKENAIEKEISFRKSKETSLAVVRPQQATKAIAKAATFDEDDDKSIVRDPKVSKLESLFRPILPAFSTDDVQSINSYDPREIKVTESAPGVIQSSKYISLAGRTSSLSLSSQSQSKNKLPMKLSPSQLSVDTQPSPCLVKDTVSNQAENNADFLFASDYGPTLTAGDPDRARSSSSLSISTSGARSRLTQRSCQTKDVNVVEKSTDADMRSVSECSYRSERRVRFSADAVDTEIDVPSGIDRTVSDLTDVASGHERRSSGIVSLRSSNEGQMEAVQEEDEHCDFSPMKVEGSWAYKEGKDAGVTPFMKGKALKKATNSPFLRFQAAKEKFDTNVAPSSSFAESIDLPETENKVAVASVPGKNGRESAESMSTLRSSRSIPESIPEEDENEIENEDGEMSPENSIHWTYNENGVTPYVKGKSTEGENAAKSPVRRFQDAKNKFSTAATAKNPKNIDSIIRSQSSAHTKSPKKESRIVKKGSGGLVSARIEELNARVSEIRKIKRMRKKLTNPRLHTHNFDNKQPVRNRALINYKTTIKSANIEKSNSYMAAKFNVIPDVDEDSAISSLGPSPTNGSTFLSGPSPMNSIISEDENASKISHGTFGSSRTDGTATTVATVVQQKDSRSGRYRAYSESTMSTSSGLSKVRKKVLFRVSDGTKSLSSNDESTTLSAIIHKENEFFPPAALHLSPVQRTPMQAMKWRSLAAAVAEKDARSGRKSKKLALGVRSNNY